MKKVLPAAALMVLALWGCNDLRVQVGIYASLAEAEQAGALARGWVPNGLPPSASDIREGHIDDRVWGAFSFDPSEADRLRAMLTPTEVTESISCRPPGRLEWWPRLLQDPIDTEAVRTTNLRIHRTRDGRLLFAVNWRQGRAYYWVV